MEKLSMCRICLVQNVRMHIVKNRHLQEIYEKLTNTLFITEDHRPILACFICYARMKQSYQLLKKCLQAEEVFSQMLHEGFEQKQDKIQGDFFGGYTTTRAEHLSIMDVSQSEDNYICDKTDIKIEEEHSNDTGTLDPDHDMKSEMTSDPEYDIPLTNIKTEVCEETEIIRVRQKKEGEQNKKTGTLDPDHSYPDFESDRKSEMKSHPEYDIPLTNIKTEVCEETEIIRFRQKKEGEQNKKTGTLDPDHSYPDFESDMKSDPEYDIPLTNIKIEVCEETEIIRFRQKKKGEQNKSAPVAKKPKLDMKEQEKKKKTKTSISNKQKKNVEAKTKTRTIIEPVLNNPVTKYNVNTSIIKIENVGTANNAFESNINIENLKDNHTVNTAVVTNLCNHIENDYCEYKSNNKAINNDNSKKHSSVHINTVTKEKPHKSECKSSFSTGGKPYKCDICQKSFNRKTHLERHIRIHTGEKPYKCDICQNTFKYSNVLKNHISIHTGEMPFKCDICQSSFNQKCHLERHNRIHTGEKPYKCDICLSSFAGRGDLKRHIYTHTGVKPYKCDICQNTFRHSNVLKNHIRIHTGEKPYKCHLCQRSFIEKSRLERHIPIHTGEKPHKCDICLSSFHRKSDLKRHIRIHTGEKPYKCVMSK